MAQTNVQAFSGDVAISSNLAVDTNTLFVDSVGNKVGIGTTDPKTPLEVSQPDGTFNSMYIQKYLGAGPELATSYVLLLKRENDNPKRFSGKISGVRGYSGANTAFEAEIIAGVSRTQALSGRMTFTHSGSTNSFYAKLVSLTYNSSTYIALALIPTVNFNGVSGGVYFNGKTNAIDELQYITDLTTLSNIVDFPVSGGDKTTFTGNVGIGTTNPVSALDVVGDVAISSNLAVSGNLNATGNFLLSDGYTQIKDRVRVLNGETSFYDPDNVLRTARRTILEINATAPNASNTAQREYTGYIELEMTAQRTVAGYGTNSGGFVGRLNFALGYTTYPSEEWGPDSFVQEIKAYDPDTSSNGLENVPRFRYKLDDATKKLQIFIEFDYQRIEASITWSVRMSSDSLDDVSIPSPTSEMSEGTLTTAPVGLAYDNIGNVGIGTATPGQKLHVHGNISTSGHQIMARIGGDTSSFNTLVFGSSDGRPHIGGHRGDYGSWADLSLQNDTMVLIQGTGNVGIGTTNPGAKLDIKGGIKISGSTSGGYHLSTNSAGATLDFTHGTVSWGRWNNAHHYDVYSAANFTGARDLYLNYYSGGAVRLVGGTTVSSDDRIKTNERYITNATETLLKLKPQIYDKGPSLGGGTGGTRVESGLIVQDIYYDAPELRHLVHYDDDAEIPDEKPYVDDDPQKDPDYSMWGTKSAGLNYEGFIAYLIKSNQELHARIQALENTS